MNKQTVFYRMNIYIPRNVQTFQSKPTRLSSFEKKNANKWIKDVW